MHVRACGHFCRPHCLLESDKSRAAMRSARRERRKLDAPGDKEDVGGNVQGFGALAPESVEGHLDLTLKRDLRAPRSPQLVGEPNRLQAPAVDRFDSRPK